MTERQRAGVLALAFGLGLARPPAAGAQWLELKVPRRPAADSAAVTQGRLIYQARCASCHGEKGNGDGPVAPYLWPRPRDLAAASYMLRTTASGELPTDEDLFRTITLGMNGTAMPAWGGVLSVEQRWQVIFYIKTFAGDLFGNPALDPYKHVLPVGKAPKASEAALIAEGRRAFDQAKCAECHGALGRGDGGKGADLRDDRGFPSRPLDMDLKWKFKGGRTVADFYMRLTTGLDGTPMPSYAKTLTDEQRWALAYYSIALPDYSAEERSAPTVLLAGRGGASLPATPDDAAWDAAPEFAIPLSGQATFPPRWQIPSVTDLSVRALYSEQDVAIRLEWDDPASDTLPADSARAVADGWRATDTYPVLYPDSGRHRIRYPDAVEVMVPATAGPAAVRPHFVYGDPSNPVDLWRWRAEAGVLELRAAGTARPPEPQAAAAQQLAGAGRWKDGRWSVVIRRPLRTDDAREAQLDPGQFIPVAFHVWDGGNAETGLRMALSSWYFLRLAPPVPASKYFVVLLALLGSAVAEYGLVRWARLRAARGDFRRYGIEPAPSAREEGRPVQ